MAKMKNISKSELLKLAKNYTIQEVAEMLDCSYTTVWKYLKIIGFETKVGRPKTFNITE